MDFLSVPQLSGNLPRSIAFNPVDDPKKVGSPVPDAAACCWRRRQLHGHILLPAACVCCWGRSHQRAAAEHLLHTRHCLQAKDSARIRDKILEHMPHALIVGAGAPAAKQLHEDIEKIVQYTIDRCGLRRRCSVRSAGALAASSACLGAAHCPPPPPAPQGVCAALVCREGRKFKELENQRTEVSWGLEAVAALWATTAEAAREFPEHSPLVRWAAHPPALGLAAGHPGKGSSLVPCSAAHACTGCAAYRLLRSMPA